MESYSEEDEPQNTSNNVSSKKLQDQVKQIKSKLSNFSRTIDEDQLVAKDVIFLGNTGSGKSTVVNYLAGKQLEAIEDEDDEIVIIAPDAVEGMEIGQDMSSCTKIPTRWVSDENIAYWDCPGFGDTEGPVQDITNAYYIHKLFDKSQKA